MAIPARRNGNANRGASQASHTTAHKSVKVACGINVDAQRIGSGRVFANRAHVQARFGFVDEVPGNGNSQIAYIHQQVQIAKENLPDEGNFAKQWDGQVWDGGGGHTGEAFADHQSQTGA